jgi:salicylate hydroxylase
MSSRKPKILIAGGGIGGITTALALRSRDIDAQLFEQAGAFRQVGAGIQLSCNATRILGALGVGEGIASIAVYPEARDYRAWDTGERLFWTPLGQRAELSFGAPYYHVHRAELLGVLLDALGQEGFRLSAEVVAFDQDENSVAITIADGTTFEGDVLVGADGIHSMVRAALFGQEHARYTGNVAWRGLVPAEAIADLELEKVTGVWMGPNRSIVQYYVSGGRTFNWIGISRSHQPARESWLAEGSIEDALAEYTGWHPTIREVIRSTPRVLRQALYDREPLSNWQIGRVVLLGDAAHPMLPFYAQGAAQSIEDAYVLAGCIATWPEEPTQALAEYVRLRQPRTAWMQDFSRREEELYQTADAGAIVDRNARMRRHRTPETAIFPPEQERLYGYDADAVLRSLRRNAST